MIPKIIHYIWFGDNQIPEITLECIQSWKQYASGYEIMFWSEKDFISDVRVSELLKNKKWAFAADLARLIVLKKYGGIYLDTDMELIKPIDDCLTFGCFLGFESSNWVANGIMGATKNHWLVEKAYELTCNQIDSKSEFKTSPVIITETIKTRFTPCVGLTGDLMLFDKDVFYPFNPYDEKRVRKQLMFRHITSNTIGIHHYQKSWSYTKLELLKIRIKRLLKRFLIT